MSKLPRRRIRPSLLVSLLITLIAHVNVNANAQSLWNVANGNWNVAGNWAAGVAPVSGGTTGLQFAGGTSYATANNIGAFSVNQLGFSNTAGTVTLTASPITTVLSLVNSSTAVLPAINMTGAGSVTLASPLTWSGEVTVTNGGSGTMSFNGTQTFVNGTKQAITNMGTGTITLADAITYATSGSSTGLVLNLTNNNAAAGSFNIGNMGALNNVTFNVGGSGAVRFNGATGGELFSNTAVLNVMAGATFDFNGKTEAMGAISGAGILVSTGNLSLSANGYYAFSGKLTGAGGSLSIAGAAQTLTLSGATSDYTGPTNIAAGRLILSANAPSGSAGALGNATSEVLVGDVTGAASAILLIDTAGVNVGRAIRVQSGNTGITTLGGLNATGIATFSGNVTMGSDSGAATGLVLTEAPGGTAEFTANLLRASGATGVTDTLLVNGGGIVALRGINTFTGATTVSAGTLLLDDATNNGNKLAATAALTLNGGSLSLTGNSAAASSQAVASLALGNSAARVTVTSGTNQTAALALGGITRSIGSTVDFSLVNTGTGAASITTTNTAGMLGAYATVNRNDWAVVAANGSIAALASGSYVTTFGSTSQTSLAASTALANGGATTNSLRLTKTAALTFNAATDVLTLNSGGLLIATTAGATSIGTTTVRGVITPANGELIINQQSTAGTLTINANIGGTNLTKSGDGALTLTGTNTYTGTTYINGGTLTITATANLGTATTALTLNGGTLSLPSGTTPLGTVSSAGHVITIGPAGGTFNFAVSQGFDGTGLAGSGTLTKTGAGNWSLGATPSTFTGALIISAGTLSMTSAQLNNAASLTVGSGATFNVNDNGTGTWSTAANGRFYLNGNGASGVGAVRLTDQSTNTAGNSTDPTTTLDREIVLQTTSRIQTENGNAAGSLSTLIFTGNVTGPGGLVKSGNGLLILTARDNSYAGTTVIENGALRLNLGNDRLPTTTNVTLGASTTSGALQLNGFAQTVGGLASTGSGGANEVTNGSTTTTGMLTLNVASGTQSYNGTLGGTGGDNTHAANNLGFIKDGAGTEVLTNANTYSGATTVKAGTLMVGNPYALGSGGASLVATNGGTTVNAGATLDLNGQTNVNEIITLNGAGPGNAGALVNNSIVPASLGNGIASLSVTGAVTTGWSSDAAVSIGSPPAGASATATPLLGINASSLTISGGGSGFGLTPVVTVTGGTGAVVSPVVGLTAASFTISGTTVYSTAPNITLQNGATGKAVLSGGTSGTVIGITITTPGSGFSSTPTISFSGGTITTAGTTTGTGNLNNFTVVGLTVVNSGTGFTSPPTVTITGNTGGTATVTGNNSFVLTGLALTSSGSGYDAVPGVSVTGGTATATANVSTIALASNSSIGGNGDLQINSTISGGFTLTKVGTGTTTLAGANSYGGTTVTAGILQVGVAGIGQTGIGAVNVQGGQLVGTGVVQNTAFTLANGAVLQAGDILSGSTTGNGRLTFTPTGIGTYQLQTGSQVILSLTTATVTDATFGGHAVGTAGYNSFVDAVTGTGDHDQLVFNGDAGSSLTFSSTLTVLGSGFIPAAGEVFNLLDWSALMATNFSGFNVGSPYHTGADDNGSQLDLPDISGLGLAWDVSRLTTSGNIAIVGVGVAPEPSRLLLLLPGLVWLGFRRRR